MLKKLPIGMQTFENLIKGDCLYIDKTKYIHELVKDVLIGNSSARYFLSRPRRFGKSLLVSTFDAIFSGKKELFKGLWIYDNPEYDWEIYPIIKLDFGEINNKGATNLTEDLKLRLLQIAKKNELSLNINNNISACFRLLIQDLAEKHQKQVVVLIDEYDKPIIDHLGKDIELAKENRDMLKSFYGVLKAQDANLKFIFLTGVSKFSKVSVFSDLNNLEDLTMQEKYAGLLGYTEEELRLYFKENIEIFAKKQEMQEEILLVKIKEYYNGYRFSKGEVKVYNPFSILLLLKGYSFENYWFNSGTPTFLIDLLINNNETTELAKLELKEVSAVTFNSYELDNLAILALLLQTGYLTIKRYNKEDDLYLLGYPNREVKESFLSYFLERTGKIILGSSRAQIVELRNCLQNIEPDFEEIFDILRIFFANVPYEIQVSKERYYQSL
ncbi:MAG: AAA family ATPase, partial [Candidatus Margulisiibacteriota bacterium]